MSTGWVHSATSGIGSLGLSVGGLVTGNPDFFAAAAGCVSGVLLTPDLDVDAGNISYHFVDRVTGPIGRFIWTYWWSAYARAFKHRSFWSHFPVVGTVIRLLYMICPLLTIFIRDEEQNWRAILFYAFTAQLISLIFGLLLYQLCLIFADSTQYVLPFILGLMISDFLHWFFDLF